MTTSFNNIIILIGKKSDSNNNDMACFVIFCDVLLVVPHIPSRDRWGNALVVRFMPWKLHKFNFVPRVLLFPLSKKEERGPWE